jgi:hypothetical protein
MTIVTTKQQDKQEPTAQVETSWRYHIVFLGSKPYPETALQIDNQESGDYYFFNPYNKASLNKKYFAWLLQTDNLRKSNQLQNHQGQSRYNPVTKKQETQ